MARESTDTGHNCCISPVCKNNYHESIAIECLLFVTNIELIERFMNKSKALILVNTLGMSLTLNQVQAATLVMDDTTPPADANFAGKTFLWEVNRTSEFNLNHLLGNLTGVYDGVRYSAKFNDAFYVDVPGVDSVGLPGYKYLQNFYVEGTDSNTQIFKMVAVRAGISPPPTDTNRHDYILRTLNLDNIHLQVTDDSSLGSTPNAMPELLIYDAINLNSSKLTMGRVTGGGNSPSELSFLGDHEINVTGTGNVIDIATATWNNTTVGNHSTSLNIADSSDLTIANGTDIFNEFNGNLSMGSGSKLTIDKSQVVLTSDPSNPKFKPSVIDNATVNITGTFGGSHASLQLTNPTIKNSTITLANNTSFRSYRRFTGGNTVGIVDFEGDNTINIGNGATFIGQAKGATTPSDGTFSFKNGTTTITGDTNAKFQASDWFIDNATVNLNNISAETYVSGLTINNSTYKGRGFDFTNLSTLSVTDSTISGPVDFGKNVALIWLNNSSTIDPGFSTQSGGTEQYARGMTFNFAQAFWSGNNTFISNIDPNGTEVVVGFPATKNYSNTLNINRANVTGFDTLNIELNPAKNALPANDYATGGAARDGIYDLVNLDNGATTDVDNPTITLGGNMPALLASKQVKKPSTDNQVSIKLEVLPVQSLITHPGVTTVNQQNAAKLLVASYGHPNTQSALNTLTNAQVAPHFNSIHPEPYSSNMTVAIEHTDTVINSVFSQIRKSAFSTNIGGTAGDGTPATRERMWLDAGYIKGDVEGVDDLGNFDYSLSHLTFGIDVAEFDTAILGAYFSAGSYDMDEHDSAIEEFSNKAYHLGLYLNQPDIGQWQLRSLLGYAYGDHNSERYVQLSNTSSKPTADYNSHSIYAGVMATTSWYSNDWVSLSTDLGFNYVYFEQQGFSEKGDPSLSLQLDDSDAQSIITALGLSATFSSLFQSYAIYPEAYIRYEHDWYARKNNEHEVSAGLLSNPNYKLDFVGQSRGENAITAGVGLTSEVTSAFKINGGVSATETTHGKEWGGSISAIYQW